MNNTNKAQELYLKCETDPKQTTLIPVLYFKNKVGGIYDAMLFGKIINKYATGTYEDDLIPVIRESFSINKFDREGWKNIEKLIYRYTRKGLLETVDRGADKYIRLISDDLYNVDLYMNTPELMI